MTEKRVRGEPLWALGTVLATWIGLRLMFWTPDVGAVPGWVVPIGHASGFTQVRDDGAWDHAPDAETARLVRSAAMVMAQQDLWNEGILGASEAVPVRRRLRQARLVAPGPGVVPGGSAAVVLGRNAAVGLGRGAAVGLAAPAAGVSVGVSAADAPGSVAVLAAAAPRGRARGRRWSGDGWLMWRQGGIGFDHGATLPAYGASQAGAVLRWRINPGSGHPVDLYTRADVALVTAPFAPAREGDLALGVIAQPFARVPVKVAVEARDSRFDDGTTHWRPAVMAVSAVPPLALPLGMRADVYAAAGYVGGAAATGFVDGQARVDRVVERFGGFSLRAGAGAWGGAQQGARRLDVGPSASLGFGLGAMAARLQVDWRVKVAGDASPGSGPVVTLAAGF